MDIMDKLKEMYRQSQPGAFDEVLKNGFENLPKLNLPDEFGISNTEYMRVVDAADLAEHFHFKKTVDKCIIICDFPGGNIENAYGILSKVLKENTGKAFTVIVVDENIKLKSIPDLTLEQLSKEAAELKKSIMELTIPKVESICYLPDNRLSRKEKKQQYNNNHRKNWRKRK